MNIGFHTARLSILTRKLTQMTSDSFTEKAEVYLLITEIMLEANHIREMTKDQIGQLKDIK
jgi:hypothetical protein